LKVFGTIQTENWAQVSRLQNGRSNHSAITS